MSIRARTLRPPRCRPARAAGRRPGRCTAPEPNGRGDDLRRGQRGGERPADRAARGEEPRDRSVVGAGVEASRPVASRRSTRERLGQAALEGACGRHRRRNRAVTQLPAGLVQAGRSRGSSDLRKASSHAAQTTYCGRGRWRRPVVDAASARCASSPRAVGLLGPHGAALCAGERRIRKRRPTASSPSRRRIGRRRRELARGRRITRPRSPGRADSAGRSSVHLELRPAGRADRRGPRDQRVPGRGARSDPARLPAPGQRPLLRLQHRASQSSGLLGVSAPVDRPGRRCASTAAG